MDDYNNNNNNNTATVTDLFSELQSITDIYYTDFNTCCQDIGQVTSLFDAVTTVTSPSEDVTSLSSYNNSTSYEKTLFTGNETRCQLVQESHRPVSDEERCLLVKEGLPHLVSHLPLTREEHKVLRKVRRKIRNKESAKLSRKKKQDYVDGLERRVKMCTQQNNELQRQVEQLQQQNSLLVDYFSKLQSQFSLRRTITGQQLTARTFLMVFVLSFSVVVPMFGSIIRHQMSSIQTRQDGVYSSELRQEPHTTPTIAVLYSALHDVMDTDVNNHNDVMTTSFSDNETIEHHHNNNNNNNTLQCVISSTEE